MTTLKVQRRNMETKAKKLRREGYVTGNLFGKEFEKVHSVAEVILHNKEKVPEGILEQHLEEIAYKATPENLVEKIEIDCTGMHIGDVLTVGDLAIAKDGKVDIQTSLDAPVVSVVAGRNDTVEDEEEAAAEETAEA